MADWPSRVPLLLKRSKRMQQTDNFEIDEPYAGTPYVTPITNDERYFFTGSIIMTKAQYQIFRLFFNGDFNRGFTPFDFVVDTGLGFTELTFQAMPNSFRQHSETPMTVTINFECYTDSLV